MTKKVDLATIVNCPICGKIKNRVTSGCMQRNLTQGPIARYIVLFSLPMIAGNIFQQLYNACDTLIVGRLIGATALSAVGSSYAVMVLLTSIILGFAMGSGVVFSHAYGAGDFEKMKIAIANAFVFILGVTLILNICAFIF
ncbi:hypothetical protein HMPREF9554_01752 [Treponema phagedenis F0421]|nr:hypothetical protein HMPREF9554_01752 [Treponema phagedenis F0421]